MRIFEIKISLEDIIFFSNFFVKTKILDVMSSMLSQTRLERIYLYTISLDSSKRIFEINFNQIFH